MVQKRKPFGYGVYLNIHKMKTKTGKGALSPYVYGKDPLKAFETVGLKPGFLTRLIRKRRGNE